MAKKVPSVERQVQEAAEGGAAMLRELNTPSKANFDPRSTGGQTPPQVPTKPAASEPAPGS